LITLMMLVKYGCNFFNHAPEDIFLAVAMIVGSYAVLFALTGIVQRGTHSELIGQPGLYAELYNAQTGLVPDRE
jgi:hypothetical protein